MKALIAFQICGWSTNVSLNLQVGRAQTIISWFKWISNNLGIVDVNKSGDISISRHIRLM